MIQYYSLARSSVACPLILGVSLDDLDIDALTSRIAQIVKVLVIVQTGFDIMFAISDLLQLFVRRSLSNAFQALMSLYAVVLSIWDLTNEVSIEINPETIFELIPDHRDRPPQNHHVMSFYKSTADHAGFTDLLEGSGITLDELRTADWNQVDVHGHSGRHRTSNHEYVYQRVQNRLQVHQARNGGMPLSQAQKHRVIRRAIGTIKWELTHGNIEVYRRLLPRGYLRSHGIDPL